jgi:hypothetical protein
LGDALQHLPFSLRERDEILRLLRKVHT